MESLSEITYLKSRAEIVPPTTELLSIINRFDWKKLDPYMFLDQILTDRIGQDLTMQEILAIVKNQYPDLYQLVFGKSLEICSVLS